MIFIFDTDIQAEGNIKELMIIMSLKSYFRTYFFADDNCRSFQNVLFLNTVSYIT